MQYEIRIPSDRSMDLIVSNGGRRWKMSVSIDELCTTFCVSGRGVAIMDPAWLLRELALMLPPEFVDQEDHEAAISEAF